MEILLRSLTQYSGEILLLLVLFDIALLVAYCRRAVIQDRLNSAAGEFLAGGDAENVEQMLLRHLHERADSQAAIANLLARVEELETQLSASKRHLGAVRYDAFDDVGGNQSFALALFDDHGDGAVLNGVVGRTHAKVYCKPLVNGRSDRDLSQEEQRALREGRASKPKSVISI